MKKSQTALKKTASKTGIPKEPTKKVQKKKRLSRLDEHFQSDLDEKDPIALKTFGIASQQQKTQTVIQDDHTECLITESEDLNAEMMEEIEKEIYESLNQRGVSPIQKLRQFETECTNDEEIPGKLKTKGIGIQNLDSKKRNNGMENKKNPTMSLVNKQKLNISSQTEKIQSESEEESINVPRKESPKEIHSQLQSSDQKMAPRKQLKSSESPNRKFLNFSIDIKLLRSHLPIKRIIKCLESNQIDGKWTAKFLIETQNEQQIVVDNEEMIFFYKDSLIDYYQGIHFS